MSMVCSLTQDREDLEHLHRWRDQLATRLSDAANRLEVPGEPLPDELLDNLESYGTRTRQLAEQLGATVGGTGEGADAELSLLTLQRLLEDRERREQILPVIDAILNLRHVESADFEPLLACQRDARRLAELVRRPDGMQAHADIDAITRQTHPFNHLLRLCDREQELSDSDWNECNDRVTAAYGRPLATAVARGRIQRAVALTVASMTTLPSPMVTSFGALSSSADQPIVIEATANSRSSPALPTALPAGLGADSIFQPSPLENSVFDEPKPPQKLPALTWPTTELNPIEQSSPPPPTPPRSAPQPALIDSRSVFSLRDADATDARLTSPQRSELVTQLIAADRLPLAMHLARCAETRPGQPVPYPPVWLLRSLILGTHLSDSKGELSRLMDDDLDNFRLELLTEGDADRQVASGFLLRAAALPAALLSGSATANAILRAIKISPGCSQLYNYCSRIARYGDRLDGQIVEMFRPQVDDAEDLAPESLAESASRWLEETARKPVTYSRTSLLFLHAHWTLTASTSIQHAEATQLWCRWQEALQVASRLLRPVIGNLDGERHWVRQEIARLSTHMRSEAAALRSGTATNGSADETHAVLRQAIELANRWLRLSGATSSNGGNPSSPDALDLRDEVLARTAGVLSELNEQWQLQTSSQVRAGIACCRRSVERIHALFAGSRSLPLRETNSRHALHAELLKIPDLELNDQWLPESDPITLERALIEHMQQKDASWRTAFEMHALHGDHVATERLLELNVWSSEAERTELQTLRTTQIAEQRQALARELTEAARDLEVVERLGQLDGTDGEVFAQRLDRLRRDLPGQLNFGSCRWQLDQIRSALQRRRQRSVSAGGLTQLGWNTSPAISSRPLAADEGANEPTDLVLTNAVPTRVTDIFSEE